MAAIYDNSAFICSYQQRSHLTDKDSDERSVKWIKVLLIVVGVFLVFALGVICVLSLLYVGKFSLCDSQQHNDTKPPTDPEQNFSASSCKLCEEGWKSYGGKCYFFSSEKMTWFEARDSCTASKAHLVTINSKAVQDFLVSKINETHWIGLNDLETEGRWVWVNNKTLEETGVEFWYKREFGTSEPDNWKVMDPSGENCASLGDRNGNLHTWFDGSCKEPKRFICEKKY
nr:natural killer cells antigen CD94-like [Misgurnus anguillicaudatus]